MKKFIKIILYSVFLFGGFSGIVLADTYDPRARTDDFMYLFRLSYDRGRFSRDRDFKFAYDIIADTYRQTFVGSASFFGEVTGILGNKLASFSFDVPVAREPIRRGKVSVPAPYFANARDVTFYSPTGVRLLTISVQESSFCNDDYVCNNDVGENFYYCPHDCVEEPITLTRSPSPSSQPEKKTDEHTLPFVVLGAFGIIGIIVAYLIFFRGRKIKIDSLPPVS